MTFSSSAVPSSPLGVPLYAWLVVLMLWPVAMLNYLDRQMVASLRASIRADIATIANDADFGLLMALFMWVYAFFSPIGGYIADRFNRRWTVIGSLAVWSLVTWLTGQARTFEQMAWARGFMGISEAFYIPAALALIADFHPGPTRSRAVGIHMSGIYAGQALGGVGGYIADTSSWRNAFYWFGSAGVVYAVLLLLCLRDTDKSVVASSETPASVSVGRTLGGLASAAGFFILVVYFTLLAMPGWAVKNWLPTHLAAVFGLRQGPAGMSADGLRHACLVCRSAAGRCCRRSLDASDTARTGFHQRAGHGVLRAGIDRAQLRPDTACGHRLHGGLRARVRVFRCQQHAHPVSDRESGIPRYRLRCDEHGEYQLRRGNHLGDGGNTRQRRFALRRLPPVRRGHAHRRAACAAHPPGLEIRNLSLRIGAPGGLGLLSGYCAIARLAASMHSIISQRNAPIVASLLLASITFRPSPRVISSRL